MPTIKPFAALRPVKDKAGLVSAQPYDSSHPEISLHEFQNNPYSYLHVVKPFMDFPGEKKDSAKHFPHGLSYLQKLKDEGTLTRERQAAFYIYRLIKGSRAYTTLIAAASIDDYCSNRILKHENTLTDKQNELAEHIRFFNGLGNPVLLTYPDNQRIDETIEKHVHTHAPEYNFISYDQVKHNLWIVDDSAEIKALESAFAETGNLYIADGHHRTAGCCTYAEWMRSANPHHTGNEAYNFFPACLIPFSRLHIYEYHATGKRHSETRQCI